MQIGSLVQAIEDFDDVRRDWGFNYPNKGDILTITDIEPYTFGDMAKQKKYVMLYFEELRLPLGICSRCFREVQPPMDLSELMRLPAREEIKVIFCLKN